MRSVRLAQILAQGADLAGIFGQLVEVGAMKLGVGLRMLLRQRRDGRVRFRQLMGFDFDLVLLFGDLLLRLKIGQLGAEAVIDQIFADVTPLLDQRQGGFELVDRG